MNVWVKPVPPGDFADSLRRWSFYRNLNHTPHLSFPSGMDHQFQKVRSNGQAADVPITQRTILDRRKARFSDGNPPSLDLGPGEIEELITREVCARCGTANFDLHGTEGVSKAGSGDLRDEIRERIEREESDSVEA